MHLLYSLLNVYKVNTSLQIAARPTLGRRSPGCASAGSSRHSFPDVDVVGETVQQRSGETLRPGDLGPFVERQVGGDQDRSAG